MRTLYWVHMHFDAVFIDGTGEREVVVGTSARFDMSAVRRRVERHYRALPMPTERLRDRIYCGEKEDDAWVAVWVGICSPWRTG